MDLGKSFYMYGVLLQPRNLSFDQIEEYRITRSTFTWMEMDPYYEDLSQVRRVDHPGSAQLWILTIRNDWNCCPELLFGFPRHPSQAGPTTGNPEPLRPTNYCCYQGYKQPVVEVPDKPEVQVLRTRYSVQKRVIRRPR